MNEIEEFFGEPISVYTDEEAVDDGILMRNPSTVFRECNLLTATLWNAVEEKDKKNPVKILDRLMREAQIMYVSGQFNGDNDRDFFTIRHLGLWVWFARNGHNRLTAMTPSDY